MKKNIIIFILSLSTLFFALNRREASQAIEELNPSHELAPNEVSVLIEDFPKEEGAAITESENVIKARLYYEKAFKLFLITIGAKLSDDQEEELTELIDSPENYLDKSSSAQDSGKDIKVEQVAKDYDFTPAKVFAQLLKDNDMVFDHISDQGMMKKLQQKVLKDPSLYYARSKYVKRIGPLKKIMGEYRGKLFRVAGSNKGRIDDIALSMKFFMKEEKVEGDFMLALSTDGNSYSNSQGNGGNGNVRIRRGSIIIESGPGSFFHFADNNFELANFYTNGELVGFAKLEKI